MSQEKGPAKGSLFYDLSIYSTLFLAYKVATQPNLHARGYNEQGKHKYTV